MTYSTPADLRLVLAPGIEDGTNPPETPTRTAADLSNAQLQSEIRQADQTIDGYVGRFYFTPVSDEDAAKSPIKTWSTNIAVYLATLTNRRGADLTPNDPVALRYATTMQQILAVNAGRMQLPIGPQTGNSDASGAGDPVNPAYVDPFGSGMRCGPYAPQWRDAFGTPANQLTAREVEIIQRGMQ